MFMTALRTALILLLFAAIALPQRLPVQTVSVQFSGAGVYMVSDNGALAALDGTGQLSYAGSVHFAVTIHEVSPQVCTFYFWITQEETGSAPSQNIAYLGATGGRQTCNVDNRVDGTQTGTANVTEGELPFSPTQTYEVQSGSMAFNIAGQADNWTMNGTATLYVTAFAPTAGPGGSGYPPVVAGPGGSGYPIITNGANSGSVLVFDNENTGASSAARGHAAGGPASIQIPLPVQSAASTYTVGVECMNSVANCWIQIPTATGTMAAGSSATIGADLNPQGLSPGVYSAIVTIALTPSAGESGGNPSATINLPLTAIVTSGANMLGIPETGLQFQVIAGGQSQSQSISISDLAPGVFPFSVSSSESSGGPWLSAVSGATIASTEVPVTAELEANPASLAPGTYFGNVGFSAPGVVNSPESVYVALTVLPPSNTSAPVLSSTALTIVANGSNAPVSQQVALSTLSYQQVPVSAIAGTNDGADWLTVSPATGTAIPAQPFSATITAQTNGLQPGVYQGSVIFQDGNDSSTYPVSVQLVVPPAASCTPTRLLPVISNLSAGSNITAALPVPLQVDIVDDCGSPLTAGSVVAYFSSGDPAVTLQSTGNGQWAGTWFPHEVSGGVVDVTVSGSSFAPALSGSATAASVVSANSTAPVVSLAGVVSAAAPTMPLPVAPGGFISIFGSNLATATASAPALPLPTVLGDTEVLLGGRPLLLDFVSSGQINAVVPYGAPVNAIQQLTVIRNGIYSPPEILVVAPTEPAVFTQDQSGTGAGVISVVKPDGTQFLNTASAPAMAGDALVIYCTGLGTVNPAVLDGAAAPSSPPAQTVNPVAVTIGGKTAPVAFSGLAPGFVGLYQVNVTVPGGIAPATDVPLTLSVGNTTSPVVTVAVQ